jgi:CheY-like chemotaxis protein
MHDIVREVSAILERSIDKTITMAMEFGASECTVIGDPTQLQGALLNIAANARDAMPNGGQIRFATNVVDAQRAALAASSHVIAGDRYVEISIQDSGVGMDALTMRRVFEPFFTTKAPHGTGMGLAAAHGTIVAHNGSISVQSKVGEGSTFRVYLPLTPEPVEGQEPATSTLPHGEGHVLIVEDEPVVRRMVHSYLAGLGYEVTSASDGVEAVEIFARLDGAFDLVLLDLILPRMDGASVFASLRSVSPTIRVLLMSGHTEELVVSELLQCGAVDLVRKPFTLSSLAQRVKSAIHPDTAGRASGASRH